MKRTARSIAGLAALGLAMSLADKASAWEAATHAGIAEEAALHSELHSQLVATGWDAGLYTTLAIADSAQPALIAMIRRISPSLGVFLDAKGAAPALSWLVAGAIIADIGSAQHHFHGPGWSLSRFAARLSGMPSHGISAIDWISQDSVLGEQAFYAQLGASVTASSPAQRGQHLAAALLAAGAITHLIADMGSPSHAKGDAESHTEALAAPGDRTNRLERVATLAFGRLGVPSPAGSVEVFSLRRLIEQQSTGTGIAAITARTWYSENTLPRNQHDTLATPRLPSQLSLMAASQETGTTLRNSDGVCLAHYRLAVGRVTFWLDDACRLEQVRAILPLVSTYARGALQFLFRGRLHVTAMSNGALIGNQGVALGAGTIEVYSQSSAGVRARMGSVTIKALDAEAELEMPLAASGTAYAAIFVGVDANGQPVTATGAVAAP
ncbi:MAG: hypothetical protein IPL79_05605 [Myxococcales bacterium]|nr:hypothetical protein [Myxococcales bacterium]